MHVLLVSSSPKYYSVSLHDHPFSRYRKIWDKCTKGPWTDLESYKVKDTLYILLISQGSKFHPISFYDQSFSRYKVVDSRKCTK